MPALCLRRKGFVGTCGPSMAVVNTRWSPLVLRMIYASGHAAYRACHLRRRLCRLVAAGLEGRGCQGGRRGMSQSRLYRCHSPVPRRVQPNALGNTRTRACSLSRSAANGSLVASETAPVARQPPPPPGCGDRASLSGVAGNGIPDPPLVARCPEPSLASDGSMIIDGVAVRGYSRSPSASVSSRSRGPVSALTSPRGWAHTRADWALLPCFGNQAGHSART